MQNNAGVCNQIIGLSHNWPADVMTGKEFRDAMLPLSLGYNYLNPAGEYTWFPVQEKGGMGSIEISIATGSKMIHQEQGCGYPECLYIYLSLIPYVSKIKKQ